MRHYLPFFMLLLLVGNAQAEPYNGPIADAHAHLPKSVSVDFLADVYQQAGVERAVIFTSTFDRSKLLKFKRKLGEGFVLFPDVHKGKKGRYRIKQQRLEKMGELYQEGLIGGIGEVYINLSYAPFARRGIQSPIDSFEKGQFWQQANKLGMPVHLHHEAPDTAFSETLESYQNINFILAHSGYLAPEVLDQLMAQHPNLYADLSLISNAHFGPFNKAPRLDKKPSEAWRALLIKHQDRFMLGSDIGANKARVSKLPAVIEDYRILLGNLPIEVARKIAYQNFERVFVP